LFIFKTTINCKIMSEFNPTRRRFLGKLPLAVIGTTLLSSQLSYAFVTKDDSPFEGYDSNTKDNNDLRSAISSGTTLKVFGTVYGTDGLQVLPNARIEVWHLSPGSNKYDHKGAFSSNANGEYSFRTDMPNRKEGKMPRIFFKISNEGRVVFTELLLNSHDAFITHKHWENNRALNKRLFPVYKKKTWETEIQFNVSV